MPPKKVAEQLRIELVHPQYAVVFREGQLAGVIHDRLTAEYLSKLLSLQNEMNSVRGKLADFLGTAEGAEV